MAYSHSQNRSSQERMALLSRAPVPRALLALGLPAMLGMMVNALYNLADAYFVGRLGASAMGAISVVFPLAQAIVGLGLMMGSGAASLISRLLGAGERDAADRVAGAALYGALCAGAAAVLLTLALLRPILRLLGATDSILPHATAYAAIVVPSLLLNVFNVAMNHLVTSEGAARTSMRALLTGAILNIALDPLMITGLGLGIAGAALATAVSQAVSTLIYLRYIRRGGSAFRFRLSGCRPSRAMLAEILKIGVPVLAFQLLTGLAAMMTNMQAKAYGDAAIAALGAAARVISMGSLMVFGFVKGLQPLAGYSCGAGNWARLREAVRLCLLWMTAFCVLFGAGVALFAGPLMGRFAQGDAAMLRIGEGALRANGGSFALFGLSAVYSALYLALGRGREGFWLGACRQGVFFVPAILLLPAAFGLPGIVLAQPVADVATAAVSAAMAWRLRGELRAKA